MLPHVGAKLPLEVGPPRRRARIELTPRVLVVAAAAQHEQGAHREGEHAARKRSLGAKRRGRQGNAEGDDERERHRNEKPADEPSVPCVRSRWGARGGEADRREERDSERQVDEQCISSRHECWGRYCAHSPLQSASTDPRSGWATHSSEQRAGKAP